MKIHDDHLYHGAALIQIAEDRHFTSINSFEVKGEVINNVYKINDTIGVYLKYSSIPKGKYLEYQFTFGREHLQMLERVNNIASKLVIGLVCVKDRDICCLSYTQLRQLVSLRRKAFGDDEEQYVVLLTALKDEGFHAYVSPPGTKGSILKKAVIVARNKFPKGLFD